MKTLVLSLALAVAAAGCSKHDCELTTESDKKNFGEVAEMTGGAANCFLSNNELIATHGDTTVDKITDKYKAFLESKGWKTEVKDHTGKRSNGNEYQGKLLAAEKGDQKIGTLIYPLGETLIETVTITRD